MFRAPLSLLLLILPAVLPAQFDIGLRLVDRRSSAHADAPRLTDSPGMRPQPALGVGVDLGWQRGPWRFGLSGARAGHDLAVAGGGSGVLSEGLLRSTSVTVRGGRALLRRGGGELAWAVGVTGIHWSFPGVEEPARWRWGATGLLEATAPVSARWQVVSQLAVTRMASLFTDQELPEGYHRRGAMMFELSIGLRYSGHPR